MSSNANIAESKFSWKNIKTVHKGAVQRLYKHWINLFNLFLRGSILNIHVEKVCFKYFDYETVQRCTSIMLNIINNNAIFVYSDITIYAFGLQKIWK